MCNFSPTETKKFSEWESQKEVWMKWCCGRKSCLAKMLFPMINLVYRYLVIRIYIMTDNVYKYYINFLFHYQVLLVCCCIFWEQSSTYAYLFRFLGHSGLFIRHRDIHVCPEQERWLILLKTDRSRQMGRKFRETSRHYLWRKQLFAR